MLGPQLLLTHAWALLHWLAHLKKSEQNTFFSWLQGYGSWRTFLSQGSNLVSGRQLQAELAWGRVCSSSLAQQCLGFLLKPLICIVPRGVLSGSSGPIVTQALTSHCLDVAGVLGDPFLQELREGALVIGCATQIFGGLFCFTQRCSLDCVVTWSMTG